MGTDHEGLTTEVKEEASVVRLGEYHDQVGSLTFKMATSATTTNQPPPT